MTIEELKALEAAATPGPWRAGCAHEGCAYVGTACGISRTEHSGEVVPQGYNFLIREMDATFVAAARNMLPRLIAVAEAAKVLRPLARECIGDEDAFYAADDELGRALAALDAP